MIWLIIFVTLNYCTELGLAYSDYNYEALLTDDLLTNSNYSKNLRPSAKVEINLTIFINQINSIDDSNQLMTSSINIMAEWEDPRLAWDPSLYNHTDTLLVRGRFVNIYGILRLMSIMY